MENITIQLVPGHRVRMPDGLRQPIGDEPITVAKTPYWTRRLMDGSVVEVQLASESQTAKKSTK